MPLWLQLAPMTLAAMALVTFALALRWMLRDWREGLPPEVEAKALLTPNEHEFYQRLRAALPEFEVLCQVSMGALMNPARGTRREAYHRVRNGFCQKVVDFVICDRELNVVTLVELDDRTHDPQRDEIRDRLTSSAGYRTLRFESRQKPSVEMLRSRILPG